LFGPGAVNRTSGAVAARGTKNDFAAVVVRARRHDAVRDDVVSGRTKGRRPSGAVEFAEAGPKNVAAGAVLVGRADDDLLAVGLGGVKVCARLDVARRRAGFAAGGGARGAFGAARGRDRLGFGSERVCGARGAGGRAAAFATALGSRRRFAAAVTVAGGLDGELATGPRTPSRAHSLALVEHGIDGARRTSEAVPRVFLDAAAAAGRLDARDAGRIGLGANIASQDLAFVGSRLCFRSMRDGHERAEERNARVRPRDGDHRSRRLATTYKWIPSAR